MGAQATVRVRRVGVGILGRSQDRADIDAGLQPLLAEGQTLQLLEAVLVRGTVDDSVTKDLGPNAGKINGGFGRRAWVAAPDIRVWRWLLRSPHAVLELPRVAVPVVHQAGIVIALVEILEDGRKDLGLLVREGDSLVHDIQGFPLARRLEKGRLAEDILVRGKEPSLAANSKSDNRRGRDVDGLGACRFVLYVRDLQLGHLRLDVLLGGGASRLLQPSRLVDAVLVLGLVLRPERALEHFGGDKLEVAKERGVLVEVVVMLMHKTEALLHV